MLKSIISPQITLPQLLIVLFSALILGLGSALVFSYKNKESSTFCLSLVILPIAMTMLVLIINGNFGVAVALVGGFAIVKFRSSRGNGREISAVYTVMTLGVICGMGFIAMAAIFFVIIATTTLILTIIDFGNNRKKYKLLCITIPEDYDYENLFDDIFEKYNVKATIDTIKSISLGSLFEITYKIELPDKILKKEMLDELRTRNCNLTIIVTSEATKKQSL